MVYLGGRKRGSDFKGATNLTPKRLIALHAMAFLVFKVFSVSLFFANGANMACRTTQEETARFMMNLGIRE